MHFTDTIQEDLIQFLRITFPESRSVPAGQIKQNIGMAWQKGSQYGFDCDNDLGIYVIAAYALGENFEAEVPEAAVLLRNTTYSSRQKADRLEKLAKQVLADRGYEQNSVEAVDANIQDMLAREAAMQANGAAPDGYSAAQMASQPYQMLAYWVTEKLRRGNTASVLKKMSPNLIREVGIPKIEEVLREQIVPYFRASMDVAEPAEPGKTCDKFGSEGYYFSMNLFALRQEKPFIGYKPFVLILVKENDQLVIASLDVNARGGSAH